MRGTGLTTSGGSPYFFLSYAHTPSHDSSGGDPSVWVKKLYDGLCEHIRGLTDLPRGAKVGFLDEKVSAGTKWTDELSMNLARCKVFVPLYSPRYFMSRQCGREWWAFSRRQVTQRAHGGPARENTIIPALWMDERPPEFDIPVLARTRFDLPQGRKPDFHGDQPHDWNPYHPESTVPLGDHAAELVRMSRMTDRAGHYSTNASSRDLDFSGNEPHRAVRSAIHYYGENIATYPPEGPPYECPRLRGPDLG
ncbi:TIR-like protein FxsC [Streptomyces sp. MA5143a]|uniref:TIR-like protein FxsC n=1 Tax=Streptomyces sp. MA5143a TaxID=2083010 RepID=UPI000D2959FB|nr:TIR-like protein FxsC [Streptomyces sp. MA5143a]SPF01809.1 hypothetical protein SMA5143A_2547 [Streptomyces sp. MA5143a]